VDNTGLHIVEKYDEFMDYIYPKIQSIPKRHGRFREKFLDTLLRLPGEIYLAVKVKQISKLYVIDATLAEIRWMLRFAVTNRVRLITPQQHSVAMIRIAEVGNMLNAWIKRTKH
jgi:hypothetical protein